MGEMRTYSGLKQRTILATASLLAAGALACMGPEPLPEGCGLGLWAHVHHPRRLTVLRPCITVSGTVVDASQGKRADGVRPEADGDAHGWLQVDSSFAWTLDSPNAQYKSGNLIYEVVCTFPVTQEDAKSACIGWTDSLVLPPIGSKVRITGTLVRDDGHWGWNEIHPVASIEVDPSGGG
jgi:hypothetical protein